jgi:hypothetical protein
MPVKMPCYGHEAFVITCANKPSADHSNHFGVTDSMVGNPYLIAIWKGCPSCIPNLPCAKTSEAQFDFVPQKSGHEGAVSNAVMTA